MLSFGLSSGSVVQLPASCFTVVDVHSKERVSRCHTEVVVHDPSGFQVLPADASADYLLRALAFRCTLRGGSADRGSGRGTSDGTKGGGGSSSSSHASPDAALSDDAVEVALDAKTDPVIQIANVVIDGDKRRVVLFTTAVVQPGRPGVPLMTQWGACDVRHLDSEVEMLQVCWPTPWHTQTCLSCRACVCVCRWLCCRSRLPRASIDCFHSSAVRCTDAHLLT